MLEAPHIIINQRRLVHTYYGRPQMPNPGPRISAVAQSDFLNDEGLLQLFLSSTDRQRDELFVNAADAARITGLSRRTIESWIEAGSIQAVRVGKKNYQIYRPSLIEYLKARTSAA
jgi:excisionase family DNA binding protein